MIQNTVIQVHFKNINGDSSIKLSSSAFKNGSACVPNCGAHLYKKDLCS